MKRYMTALVAIALMSCASNADSLFSAKVAHEGPIVAVKKARFKVGDIITVTVRENLKATTTSDTNTKKESTLDAKADLASNSFLVRNPLTGTGFIKEGELPNWGIDIENEHKGEGETTRSNQLITTVTCMVVDVLTNDNILLAGEKVVTVNREDSRITVQGMARARDVTPDNKISSDLLANAEIKLNGKGPLWNNDRRGLLTKLLDWVSPF